MLQELIKPGTKEKRSSPFLWLISELTYASRVDPPFTHRLFELYLKMGLEATMIMYFFVNLKAFTDFSVDNSEHTRNGDFTPTRFAAQSDAVNLLFGAKIQSNAESTVGIMTLAGKM